MCIKYGIPFGVYLYSYAHTVEDAKSEANHVLRLLEPYKGKLSYPVYYDLEEKGTENGAVERAIAFGDIIEANGYWCGIYANQHWWRTYLKDGLDRFTKWVAKYSSVKPSGISGTYDIWQYSSSGTIPGISRTVDMNLCYRDFPSEIKGVKPKYYNTYKGKSNRVDEVLISVGVPAVYVGNWKCRRVVAVANGIPLYVGTAAQNNKLISLAKQGKLARV
jgi:GH25 family lysozyme M1 (1,4-beta-N-acetylmuramidase)